MNDLPELYSIALVNVNLSWYFLQGFPVLRPLTHEARQRASMLLRRGWQAGAWRTLLGAAQSRDVPWEWESPVLSQGWLVVP